jgi:hypothetical protein
MESSSGVRKEKRGAKYKSKSRAKKRGGGKNHKAKKKDQKENIIYNHPFSTNK